MERQCSLNSLSLIGVDWLFSLVWVNGAGPAQCSAQGRQATTQSTLQFLSIQDKLIHKLFPVMIMKWTTPTNQFKFNSTPLNLFDLWFVNGGCPNSSKVIIFFQLGLRAAPRFLLHSNQRFSFRSGLAKPNPPNQIK